MYLTMLFSYLFILAATLADQSNMHLPNTTMSMKDMDLLFDALERGIAISYAHFNDGEILAIECADGVSVDFGFQKCSHKLRYAMSESLENAGKGKNFYFGVACLCMWKAEPFLKTMKYLNITTSSLPYALENLPGSDREACPASPVVLNMTYSSINRDRITVGTVFLNENYQESKRRMNKLLYEATTNRSRGVHAIIGSHKDHKKLPFPLTSVHYVPKTEAFDAYDVVRSSSFLDIAGVKAGDYVLIMAGPMGRILASEYSQLRDDISFLDMGSFWDEDFGDAMYIHGGSAPCMFANDRSHTSSRR